MQFKQLSAKTVLSAACGRIFICCCFLALFQFSQIVNADPDEEEHKPQPSPLWGMSVGGYFGNGGTGWADALVPLMGKDTDFGFINLQAQYHDDETFAGSVGLGRRFLTEKMGILGFYLFGDYNNPGQGNSSFWFLGPGFERLGDVVDFSVNAYLPVTTDTKNTVIVPSDNSPFFTQHSLVNQLNQLFYSTGFNADAEVGFRITTAFEYQPEIFLGGYYASPQDFSTVTGGTIRLELPVTKHLTITASEAYDNYAHNTLKAGLNLSFADRQNRAKGAPLAVRLLDPIRRNLVSTTGSMLGTNQFIEAGSFPVSQNVLQEHIWFFTTNGGSSFVLANGLSNCTFEHPCEQSAFVQSTVTDINGLDSDALLYFSPGTYLPNAQITIQSGQTLWGRTENYSAAAPDAFRPVIQGAFNLSGNNEVHNLNLSGLGTGLSTGVLANGANNIVLSQVGVSHYAGAAGSSAFGINMTNSNNIQFTQVAVSDIQGGNGTVGANGVNGSDNFGGPAGNGTAGTGGGIGGNATGVLLSTAQNAVLNGLTISAVQGGNGGNGGNGGDGGDASEDGGDSSQAIGGTGGNGGAGGSGGTAGDVIGLSISSAQDLEINQLRLSNIIAGNGGTSGNGGNGGNANATNGSVSGDIRAGDAGTGGDGGSSGSGGGGGSVVGVDLDSNTSVDLSGGILSNLQGGAGGSTGTGGVGGTANALDNTNSNSVEATVGLGGPGGRGGDSGNGGIGGEVVGLTANDNVNLNTIDRLVLTNLIGGNGGSAGNSGAGGNSDASNNRSLAAVAGPTASALIGESGMGGESGLAGDGGVGGNVVGISLINSAPNANLTSFDSPSLSSLMGGDGGQGGTAGPGGNVNANLNTLESAVVNAGTFNVAIARNSGSGGDGGNGNIGGDVTGFQMINSNSEIADAELSLFQAGAGGDGGQGGDSGNVTSNNNALLAISLPAGPIAFIGTATPDFVFPALGGSGGDGGTSRGMQLTSTTMQIQGATFESFSGGKGGNGGLGGAGGASTANENSMPTTVVVTGARGGRIEQDVNIDGEAGGAGGVGGAVTGIETSVTLPVSNVTLNNILMNLFISGNGGNGAAGGAGGSAGTSDNTASGTGDVIGGLVNPMLSVGGAGGTGQAGGNIIGLDFAANTIGSINNITLQSFTAGNGGNGGAGAIGGNANSSDNTGTGGSAVAGRAGQGGDGGTGNIGGAGGDITSLISGGVTGTITSTTLFTAGTGGSGGAGANGGNALATGGTGTNIQGTGGDGGNGEDGGNGGAVNATPGNLGGLGTTGNSNAGPVGGTGGTLGTGGLGAVVP